jgi:hypothetical protein
MFPALALAAAFVALPGFHSPSGNIACYVAGPLRCTIGHASYARTLQDRCLNPDGEVGAGVDWHGWELGATTSGRVTCSGGILYDSGTRRPVYADLPYGKSWTRGVFTCVSRRTGITCRTPSGHGLFVARQSWRAW